MNAKRLGDAALVAVSLALTLLAVKGHWSAMPPAVIATAGALGSAALYPRRRWLVPVAIVTAVSYALSGNPLPILAGIYSGAAHAPRRQVWIFPLAGWSGFMAWSLIDAGRIVPQDAAAEALAVLLLAALGLHVATRRELAESWRERAERADAERRLRDERARADERTRIAREMHDVLAHKVSLIALHAGALELVAAGGDERVREGAGLIRVTAREALQELREVLGVLQSEASPSDLPDLPTLIAAATQAGQEVELHDEAGSLPSPTARVVYRVIQEGLTNARKHAPGAPVSVSVTGGPTVVVDVSNAPVGTPALDLPGTGAGLVGLSERLRLAGGTCEAGPTDDGGWCLTATIPRAAEAP
jgi:signal transduction histidine kinase